MNRIRIALCAAVTCLAIALPASLASAWSALPASLTAIRSGSGGVAVRLKGLAAPEVAHGGDPGEPGGIEAKAFMVELVEGETVVCDLIKKRTHGRRVGWCYRDGEDITEALIRAGLARDCPGFSGGRYAAVEPAAAREPPFAGVLSARLVAGSR